MDGFSNKLVPYIVNHKQTNFDKHIGTLRIICITNP